MSALQDLRFMDTALALARSQLGQTAPNPAVGCVLVANGQIIATGATAKGGRPHAESQALDTAKNKARGATAYVTLEPCAHHGQTPPCAETLVNAGISHVVIACIDKDNRVSGRGIKILENAGIIVKTGLCNERAIALYEGFFHRIKTGMPRLYVDANPKTYDAVLTELPATDVESYLKALGDQGLNRINILPESPFIPRLRAAGLLPKMSSLQNSALTLNS